MEGMIQGVKSSVLRMKPFLFASVLMLTSVVVWGCETDRADSSSAPVHCFHHSATVAGGILPSMYSAISFNRSGVPTGPLQQCPFVAP